MSNSDSLHLQLPLDKVNTSKQEKSRFRISGSRGTNSTNRTISQSKSQYINKIKLSRKRSTATLNTKMSSSRIAMMPASH